MKHKNKSWNVTSNASFVVLYVHRKKVVEEGDYVLKLLYTVTKTLEWLSSLPVLMQESFWWWQCSDRYIIYVISPSSPIISVSPASHLSVQRCWLLLIYRAILCSEVDTLHSHVIPHEWIAFNSLFLNSHWSGVLTLLLIVCFWIATEVVYLHYF